VNLVLELRPPESRLYGSWDERLAAVSRFSRPDEIHAVCEKAYALGARAVLAVLDDPIREALVSFQRWRDMALWAVVPNMFAFIRDLTDLGMVGAARARFTRLGPGAMIRTGLGAVTQLPAVLKKDFATGALLVADMELAALRGLRVSRLLLHPQLTEIGLAGGVRHLFTAVADRAARAGIEAGLATNNPLRAAEVLGPDLKRFAVIVAPANPKGWKMFPERGAVERLYQSDPARFAAAEITAGGTVAPEAALAYVAARGLGTAVLDARAVDAAYRAGAARSAS
jgi:hypothetical protein